MGFLSNVALGLFSGLSFIFGINMIQKMRSRQRMLKVGDLASLAKANAEDLRHLIPKELFPTWAQFPEFERVNWLNKELKEIWPFLNNAASAVIKSKLEPILDEYRPSVFVSLRFQKFTMGTIAPQFGGIKILESDVDEIVMEVDFKWGGNPSIILAVKTYLGVSLPVQVTDISFFGIFRISFTPLVDELPCFGAMTISLSQKPILNFNLSIIGGEVTSIPGLSTTIDGLIRTAVVDSLLWPMRHVLGIIPGDYSHLELRPVGQLDVRLVEAKDLLNLDIIGLSDPFAIIYVRPIPSRMCKSRTKSNTLHPVWNETFSLVVEDLESQRLVVSLMDEETLQQSRLLGQAALLLSKITVGEVMDVWIGLVRDVDDPKPDTKKRGQLHLEILYRPLDNCGVPIGEGFLGSGISSGETKKEGSFSSTSPAFSNPLTRKREKCLRGVLVVSMHRGTELLAKDFSGSSDPFVSLQMQLGSAKKRTKVVSQNINPIWNESFEFLVEDAYHDMLLLEVWDQDIFGKAFLGRLALTLTKVLNEGKITEEEFALNDVPRGSITLSLDWRSRS